MRDSVIARRALLALAAGAAACLWSTGPPAAGAAGRSRAPPARRRHVIALDPGHGGVDPGAISPHGLYEKTITLAAARELARQLDATGRYRSFLTRHGDGYVPLRERVERARNTRAELCLSIHA